MRWCALVLFAALATACAGDGGNRPATVIDERAGTYRGVGIGDAATDVRRVFGEREFAGSNESLMPTESEFTEDGGPWIVRIPAPCRGGRSRRPMLRYDDATFLFCEDRVYAFVVTADDAETVTAIAIGDDLADVRGTYGGFTCDETPGSGEGLFGRGGRYPYCVGTARPQRWVWFGQDPIRSITVATTSLDPRAS